MAKTSKFTSSKYLFLATHKNLCWRALSLFVFLVTTIVISCSQPDRLRELYTFQGFTMGTTFTVKVVASELSKNRQSHVQDLIEMELERVNTKMSSYLEDSELSRFNRARSTSPFVVSEDTLTVFRHAQELAELTGGAFDITVGPLVNVWGFGPEGRRLQAPSDEDIKDLIAQLGYTKIELDFEASTIRKMEPSLVCDLSAIAKGYAVDRVAAALKNEELLHYMIEVGGEIRVGGVNELNQPWRIAVERPVSDKSTIQRIVSLSELAMATSGDYRNYYVLDGVKISHTIDPRTGYPVTHQLASVTVVDELCVRADGLATALAVLGVDEGYSLAVEKEWAVLFIVRSADGDIFEQATPAFEHLMGL